MGSLERTGGNMFCEGWGCVRRPLNGRYVMSRESPSPTLAFDAASVVSAFDEDNDPALYYVFAKERSPGHHYFTISRAWPFGSGDDWGVYVEVDDQAYASYDRVARCDVWGDGIRVELAEPLGPRGQIV